MRSLQKQLGRGCIAQTLVHLLPVRHLVVLCMLGFVSLRVYAWHTHTLSSSKAAVCMLLHHALVFLLHTFSRKWSSASVECIPTFSTLCEWFSFIWCEHQSIVRELLNRQNKMGLTMRSLPLPAFFPDPQLKAGYSEGIVLCHKVKDETQ